MWPLTARRAFTAFLLGTALVSANPTLSNAQAVGELASIEDATPAATTDEMESLECLNRNREMVQLPPFTLQDFREGRAAGMIADTAALCGEGEASTAEEDVAPPPSYVQEALDPVDDVGVSSIGNRESDSGALNNLVLAFFALAAMLYFVPTFIAHRRQHAYKWIITVLNFTTGWSGVGWVWVFVWSIWPRNRSLAEPVFGDATGIDRGR